jgi:hypothetical protein
MCAARERLVRKLGASGDVAVLVTAAFFVAIRPRIDKKLAEGRNLRRLSCPSAEDLEVFCRQAGDALGLDGGPIRDMDLC